MSTEDLPYRPCVGVVLLNREGLAFIGKRPAGDDTERVLPDYAWQMPQGGIDPGEDPRAAAERELYEETNVRSVAFLAEAPEWYRYDLPPDLVGKAWKGRYRGQMQRWFAFRFTGDEREIDVHAPGGGKHEPEFERWRWERLERTPSLVIPFKRPVYEQVVEAFSGLATEGSPHGS